MQSHRSPRRRLIVGCSGVGLLVLCVGVAALLASRRQPRVPVSGKVTVDGKPLEMGVIHFIPNKSKGNNSPATYGILIKGGTYEVQEGMPPGWYRAVVSGNTAASQARRLRGFDNQDKPAAVEIVGTGGTGSYDLTLASSSSRHASKRR